MIFQALSALQDDLNQFLKRRTGEEDDDLVELSQLVKIDGSVAIAGIDKVLITLINVQQERTTLNAPLKKTAKVNPPVDLNLVLLFSAYYQPNNYGQALRSLSNVIAFFQSKQVFTPGNTPGLDARISKLTVELLNLDTREISNFWTAVGTKLLPSVMYRLRMLSIDESMVSEILPEIKGTDTGSANKQR